MPLARAIWLHLHKTVTYELCAYFPRPIRQEIGSLISPGVFACDQAWSSLSLLRSQAIDEASSLSRPQAALISRANCRLIRYLYEQCDLGRCMRVWWRFVIRRGAHQGCAHLDEHLLVATVAVHMPHRTAGDAHRTGSRRRVDVLSPQTFCRIAKSEQSVVRRPAAQLCCLH